LSAITPTSIINIFPDRFPVLQLVCGNKKAGKPRNYADNVAVYLISMKQKFTILLSLCVLNCTGQNRAPEILMRLPMQYEFQEAELTVPTHQIKKGSAFSFGLGVSSSWQLSKKIKFQAGLGYFRQRFGINRTFDHTVLNDPNRAIVQPLLIASNVNYHQLTIPVTVGYAISNDRFGPYVGLTYTPGFSFYDNYSGGGSIEGVKTSRSNFRFFSQALDISMNFTIKKKPVFSVEPYIRAIYMYKKDEVLFENPNESMNRYFSAFGLSVYYRLTK
jgi:hypothetical protein